MKPMNRNQEESRNYKKTEQRGRDRKPAEERRHNELMAEGRNAVLEALKTNENADKLYVQEGLGEGPVSQIVSEARKRNVLTV